MLIKKGELNKVDLVASDSSYGLNSIHTALYWLKVENHHLNYMHDCVNICKSLLANIILLLC